MRYLLLTGDETKADIEDAMANLREKQRRCQIASIRAEISADLDELLSVWDGAPAS